jgi:hypothetical protein
MSPEDAPVNSNINRDGTGGAGSRFRLHVGRSARERGQARSREARVDPTERAVSDQEIVDDPHQRIADLLEIFDINLVAVIA